MEFKIFNGSELLACVTADENNQLSTDGFDISWLEWDGIKFIINAKALTNTALANTELELTITDSNDNAAKIDIADAAYFARGGVYTSTSVVTGTDLEAGFYIDANNAIRYSDYQSSLIYDTFLKADFFAYIKGKAVLLDQAAMDSLGSITGSITDESLYFRIADDVTLPNSKVTLSSGAWVKESAGAFAYYESDTQIGYTLTNIKKKFSLATGTKAFRIKGLPGGFELDGAVDSLANNDNYGKTLSDNTNTIAVGDNHTVIITQAIIDALDVTAGDKTITLTDLKPTDANTYKLILDSGVEIGQPTVIPEMTGNGNTYTVTIPDIAAWNEISADGSTFIRHGAVAAKEFTCTGLASGLTLIGGKLMDGETQVGALALNGTVLTVTVNASALAGQNVSVSGLPDGYSLSFVNDGSVTAPAACAATFAKTDSGFTYTAAQEKSGYQFQGESICYCGSDSGGQSFTIASGLDTSKLNGCAFTVDFDTGNIIGVTDEATIIVGNVSSAADDRGSVTFTVSLEEAALATGNADITFICDDPKISALVPVKLGERTFKDSREDYKHEATLNKVDDDTFTFTGEYYDAGYCKSSTESGTLTYTYTDATVGAAFRLDGLKFPDSDFNKYFTVGTASPHTVTLTAAALDTATPVISITLTPTDESESNYILGVAAGIRTEPDGGAFSFTAAEGGYKFTLPATDEYFVVGDKTVTLHAATKGGTFNFATSVNLGADTFDIVTATDSANGTKYDVYAKDDRTDSFLTINVTKDSDGSVANCSFEINKAFFDKISDETESGTVITLTAAGEDLPGYSLALGNGVATSTTERGPAFAWDSALNKFVYSTGGTANAYYTLGANNITRTAKHNAKAQFTIEGLNSDYRDYTFTVADDGTIIGHKGESLTFTAGTITESNGKYAVTLSELLLPAEPGTISITGGTLTIDNMPMASESASATLRLNGNKLTYSTGRTTAGYVAATGETGTTFTYSSYTSEGETFTLDGLDGGLTNFTIGGDTIQAFKTIDNETYLSLTADEQAKYSLIDDGTGRATGKVNVATIGVRAGSAARVVNVTVCKDAFDLYGTGQTVTFTDDNPDDIVDYVVSLRSDVPTEATTIEAMFAATDIEGTFVYRAAGTGAYVTTRTDGSFTLHPREGTEKFTAAGLVAGLSELAVTDGVITGKKNGATVTVGKVVGKVVTICNDAIEGDLTLTDADKTHYTFALDGGVAQLDHDGVPPKNGTVGLNEGTYTAQAYSEYYTLGTKIPMASPPRQSMRSRAARPSPSAASQMRPYSTLASRRTASSSTGNTPSRATLSPRRRNCSTKSRRVGPSPLRRQPATST